MFGRYRKRLTLAAPAQEPRTTDREDSVDLDRGDGPADTPRRWLCRTEMERARFADMNERVRSARRVQGLSMGLAVLISAPIYGWWVAVLVAGAIAALAAIEKVPERTVALERASAASMGTIIVLLGLASLGTGGVHSPFLPFLAVPTLMLAARFRVAVVAAGLATCALVGMGAMLGALLLPPVPQAPWWVYLGAYVALLTGLAAISMTLLGAELQSRGDAVVDPLTGLFNRKALGGRFAEAAAQAKVLGGSVAVVLCDLDHFKLVNDQYGHDRGDVVLREAAYRLRKTLRTFDLVYRIGGEEFLILLPGQDLASARVVAERLVDDIAAAPIDGLTVTMSAGVSCGSGDTLELDPLMKRADVALYAAKDAGRNQVCVDGRLPELA
jgi:diguanylate cyclase (GGDEF)-like protein